MKITSVFAQNFLGVRRVGLRTDANRVNLFAGPNGAGKSSLRDAVVMALTGLPARISLKKEYAELISAGADAASVEVDCTSEAGRFVAAISLPSGKGAQAGAPHVSGQQVAALPYVLGAQHFSGLAQDARREFLFGLMRLKSDPATVQAELVGRGCDADKARAIAPLVRAGFEAAAKEAAAKARDGKAVWKSVTGQTWGSKLAAAWAPPEIEVSGTPGEAEEKAAALGLKISAADAEIESVISKAGAAQQQRRTLETMLAERDELAGRAAMIERIQRKLAVDRDEVVRAEALVQQAEAAANPAPTGAVACRCPACNAELLYSSGGLTERPELAGSEEAAVRLPEYRQALDMCRRALANTEGDLKAASVAAERLRDLNAKLADHEASAEPVDLGAALDALKAQRSKLQQERSELLTTAKAARDRDGIIARASAAHSDVVSWLAIADALAPDGIPGDMLQSALEPINQRLAESAEIAEWARVEITADMEVRTGLDERPYALLSESEQWRADAMIAEAISHLSGLRLLMLDRFDVLDLPGRGDLIIWLDALASAGQLDTALVFGTLKAPPGGLPDTVGAHWIAGGEAG